MEPSELSVAARQREAFSSGVSWSAVIGGAFVTAALSLILLALGAGFGLTVVSPWSNVGVSASAAGSAAIVWLIVTAVISSAIGGYLAGRLRTRWQTIHSDEVHFRDTANGFLVWAVAVVITAAFLAAAAATMIGSVANSAGNSTANAAAPEGVRLGGNAYFVDLLFRSDNLPTENDAILRAEAGRIFARALLSNDASAADTGYLAQMVVAKTRLSPTDAAKRVSDTIAEARQAEDSVRKATARLLLWTFLALLIGAFCASYAATIGGRQRDHVQLI